MTWLLSCPAKVVDRPDEAASHQVMPDSVGQHSCRELAGSVFGVGEPVREFEPATLIIRNGTGFIREDLQEPSWNGVAWFIELTSDADLLIRGSLLLFGNHGSRRYGGRRVELRFQVGHECLLQGDAGFLACLFGVFRFTGPLGDGIRMFPPAVPKERWLELGDVTRFPLGGVILDYRRPTSR